jgi:cobalt/nickel transport system permease protein
MAAVLVLRVATSVSLAVLIVLTTRWAHILKALRVFAVPRIFVLTLEMAYRYIFLLIGIIQAEHLAKESRTIRPASLRAERHWATSRIGHLFLRSRQMGEEVYLAMLSRGYSGEAKLLNPFRLRAGDLIGVFASVLILIAVLWFNRGT